MLNLTISSPLLLNSALSPHLTDKRTHVDIHKSIFRFQQEHIICMSKIFIVISSKFQNYLSTLIEKDRLKTGCPTDTSIDNCKFTDNQITTGSLISLTNGIVIVTLFFNINGVLLLIA